MTREPFIAYSELTNEIYIVTNKEKYRVTEQAIKAVKAIKALEQCEDAISREEVLKQLKGCLTGGEAEYQYVKLHIDSIPSVKSQEKTGHWILADEQNKEDVENDNYRFICSECRCSDIHAKGTIVPYCWKCGAKMIEPQESEEM